MKRGKSILLQASRTNMEEKMLQNAVSLLKELTYHACELTITETSKQEVVQQLVPLVEEIKHHPIHYKAYVAEFFSRFHALVREQTSKMERLGEGKLAKLQKMVKQQMLTKILSYACDVRVQEWNNCSIQKKIHKKSMAATILTNTLHRLIVKNQLQPCHLTLKNGFKERKHEESKLIMSLENRLCKLEGIVEKNKQLAISKGLFRWRKQSLLLKQEEQEDNVRYVKDFVHGLLPEIIQCCEGEGEWTDIIYKHLTRLTHVINQNNPTIYLQLQSHSHEQYSANTISLPITINNQPLASITLTSNHPTTLQTTHNTIISIINLCQQIVKLYSRLSYYKTQIQNQGWQLKLYQHYIDGSHALEDIMTEMGVAALQLYHDGSVCVQLGVEMVEVKGDIMELVQKQLEFKNRFSLSRNNQMFWFVKVDDGFCRYMGNNIHHDAVEECLVPVLLREWGRVGCQHCAVQVEEVPPLSYPTPPSPHISIKHMLQIKHCSSAQALNTSLTTILQQVLPNQPLFACFLYRQSTTQYLHIGQNSTVITVPKQILHNHVYTYNQHTEHEKEWVQLLGILMKGAIFEGSQLYLYEHEHESVVKFVGEKVVGKGLLLLGGYELEEEESIQAVVHQLCEALAHNQQLFTKCDPYMWASGVLEHNSRMKLPSLHYTHAIVTHTEGVMEVLRNASKEMGIEGSHYLWKCKHNRVKGIYGTCVEMPINVMVDEALQSHRQNVAGSHLTVRYSRKYGCKLEENLAYVPHIQTQHLKITYAGALLSTCSVADLLHTRTLPLIQFLTQAQLYDGQQQAFIYVPIHYQGCLYLMVMVYDRKNVISYTQFDEITRYYQQLLKLTFEKGQHQRERKKIRALREMLMLRKQMGRKRVLEVVGKFSAPVRMKKEGRRKLCMALVKLGNRHRYMEIVKGWKGLLQKAEHVKQVYENNIGYLCGRIKKIFATSVLTQQLTNKSNLSKGTKKLVSALHFLFCTSANSHIGLSSIFHTIQKQPLRIQHIKKQSKVEGLNKLHLLSMRKYMDHTCDGLLRIRLCTDQLSRTLTLIIEEFQLQNIGSLKTALHYLNDRVNVVVGGLVPHAGRVSFAYQLPNGSIVEYGGKVTRHDRSISNFLISCPQIVYQVLQPLLQTCFRKWNNNYLNNRQLHTKILHSKLSKIYYHNLSIMFSNFYHKVAKQNIQSLANISHKCEQMKKQMHNLHAVLESKTYNFNSHKMRHHGELNLLHQEYYRLEKEEQKFLIDRNIKRKTNATYKLLGMLMKRDISNLQHNNSAESYINIMKKEEKILTEQRLHEQKKVIGESFSRMLNKLYKRRVKSSFQRMQLVQI